MTSSTRRAAQKRRVRLPTSSCFSDIYGSSWTKTMFGRDKTFLGQGVHSAFPSRWLSPGFFPSATSPVSLTPYKGSETNLCLFFSVRRALPPCPVGLRPGSTLSGAGRLSRATAAPVPAEQPVTPSETEAAGAEGAAGVGLLPSCPAFQAERAAPFNVSVTLKTAVFLNRGNTLLILSV